MIGADASWRVVTEWIRPIRRWAAEIGALLIVALAFTEGTSRGEFVAYFALGVLLLACAMACVEAIATWKPLDLQEVWSPTGRGPRVWTRTIALTAIGSALAVQTWFHADTSIAGTDTGPPDGTAWLGRLFAPWVWSGSDLGAPANMQLQLPWAVILGLVHSAGGSAALAQRIWYTILFTGVAIGGLLLLKTLGAPPWPAAIGAAVYLLNPYVVSAVGPSPVYLLALGLAASLPACVFAAARGMISARAAGLLIGVSGPLLGYVYFNPPLVGMLLAITMASPLLALLLWGRAAASRALRATALGLTLILVVSAYWILPAGIQLQSTALGRLSALSDWTWTEGRATITNAFWLNTSWAWDFPEYYPYAPAYSTAPLSILKFCLPAVAFGALFVVDRDSNDAKRSSIGLGIAVAAGAAVLAISILILSTGTRPPGNLIFDVLYRLPFGWLLREPGRFLLLAGLGYSVLVAAFVTHVSGVRARVTRGSRSLNLPVGLIGASLLGAAITLGPGLPLIDGAVVPDHRGALPSMHVRLPNYWSDMATFIDAAPYEGAVVILPPDDFYQMPYQWGYYGTDAFIPYLMSRRVLVPSEQGYFRTTSGLSGVINLTARNLLSGNWDEADRLLLSVHAPLILVRGDVTTVAGRQIVSPGTIEAALRVAPNFALVHQSGPLTLFANVAADLPAVTSLQAFATINSNSPDLRVLSALPTGTALVSTAALPGVPQVIQMPPPSAWSLKEDQLQTQVELPAGWHYAVGLVNSEHVAVLIDLATQAKALGPFSVVETQTPSSGRKSLVARVPTDQAFNASLAVIGYPDQAVVGDNKLLVLRESYSDSWVGPTNSRHVLVDGMVNGWLVPNRSVPLTTYYGPSTLVSLGSWISVAGSVGAAAIAWTLLPTARRRLRQLVSWRG